MKAQRERWGSRIGIILAVAGSAIGLGNFLRFPGLACQNGGGAFMIPYFISFLLLGIPLCWMEWTMGRYGGKLSHGSLPGIFDAIVQRPWAKYAGVLGLFVPLVIFFYYTYIESWCLAYSVFSLAGTHAGVTDPAAMKTALSDFQGLTGGRHMGTAYAFFLVTFAVNLIVIYRGLARGIEFLCKIAVPVLVIGGVLLVVRIFTTAAPVTGHPEWNINNALGFMWNPEFGALKDPNVWMAAAGQIFFTLSVGLGAIMTYASYLREKDDVALSSLTACSMNEVAEVVIGGSIVIPAAFMFFGPAGAKQMSQSIFDLGFVTMPCIFSRIPWGEVFGFYWFFMLFLAGITSSISLMQPVVSFLEDEFGFNRRKAATALGIVCFIVSHACIFGLGAGVLDEFDFWGGTMAITLCALAEVVVFVFWFGINRGWKELHSGADVRLPGPLKYVFYITPFYLGGIVLYWAVFSWIPWILKPCGIELEITLVASPPFIHAVAAAGAVNPVILYARVTLLLFLLALLALIHVAWQRKRSAPASA
ncbi:sodium-dependent transporter [bacterium]|nr:sodium-dependent transporter [bacterium]